MLTDHSIETPIANALTAKATEAVLLIDRNNQMKDFDAAFARITSHGWLTKEEGRLLVKYAEKTSGPIVEVGSYLGRSAMLLGQLGRVVYCIDPWDDSFDSELTGNEIYNRFLSNICTLEIDVVPVRLRVEEWVPIPAEFVYLDGDHTKEGTHSQITVALSCRPVFIAIHDISDGGEGVAIRDVALERLGEWTERVERLAVWEIEK